MSTVNSVFIIIWFELVTTPESIQILEEKW